MATLTKKRIALLIFTGALGLFVITVTMLSSSNSYRANYSLRRRQLTQKTTALERVGKVLEHALKPRIGKQKGQNLGGDWVHKSVGDSESISRPNLDLMRAEEQAAVPANESVIHLGGGLRDTPFVKIVQENPDGREPGHSRVLKMAPPTFAYVPDQVMPVTHTEDDNSKAIQDDKDKSASAVTGIKEPKTALDKSRGHDDIGHTHKHDSKKNHQHSNKNKKYVNPLVVAQLYTKKKTAHAAHQLEKAVLKAKGHKLHKNLEKKEKEIHREITKAANAHVAHVKKTKKELEARAAHAAHVAKMAHKTHGSHHRVLQRLQNLSEEDLEKLRMIARDAALQVLKNAARDAGLDSNLLADAEKEAWSMDDVTETYDEEKVEDALATLLSLDDLILLDKPAVSFLDRAQQLNSTDASNTIEDSASSNDVPLIQSMLVALRDMNMTATEAERLRSDARSAAMQAIRDVVREAGMDERIQGNMELEALFSNIAAAAESVNREGSAPSSTPPMGTRKLLQLEGAFDAEDAEIWANRRMLAEQWSSNKPVEYEDEEWDTYFPDQKINYTPSYEDYMTYGTHGNKGQRESYGDY